MKGTLGDVSQNSHLLPDANVPLLDEDTCVVDRLGKSKLKHLKKTF